jgi:hypothetical protein
MSHIHVGSHAKFLGVSSDPPKVKLYELTDAGQGIYWETYPLNRFGKVECTLSLSNTSKDLGRAEWETAVNQIIIRAGPPRRLEKSDAAK